MALRCRMLQACMRQRARNSGHTFPFRFAFLSVRAWVSNWSATEFSLAGHAGAIPATVALARARSLLAAVMRHPRSCAHVVMSCQCWRTVSVSVICSFRFICSVSGKVEPKSKTSISLRKRNTIRVRGFADSIGNLVPTENLSTY